MKKDVLVFPALKFLIILFSANLGSFAYADCNASSDAPSLTGSMIDDIIKHNQSKRQGTSVSESELKRLLEGRSTLNVSSAKKYSRLLGIKNERERGFSKALDEIDRRCSTPNGHFKLSLLFDTLDVTDNRRVTGSDSKALGNNDNNDDDEKPVNNGNVVQHVGTTSDYEKGDISIRAHKNTKRGDLLVLFIHRTDGPVKKKSFDGWKFLVKCEKHPTNFLKNNTHCNHNGKNTDLGQSVFYREATFNGDRKFNIDMSGSKPTWVILTTLKNANTIDPMRDSAVRGNDGTNQSRFPSVEGRKGDMLLMSQSFDDKTSDSRFDAPSGAKQFGFVYGSDEVGFLFGKVLTKDGRTGDLTTKGKGASGPKDGLISLTIKRR